MASLQYVIDSTCTSLTVEIMYELIKEHLGQGPFKVDAILPMIQNKDRSLDRMTARIIAKAALEELGQQGKLRIEGDNILTNQY